MKIKKEKVYKLFEEEFCIKPHDYDPKALKRKLIEMGEVKIAKKYCK